MNKIKNESLLFVRQGGEAGVPMLLLVIEVRKVTLGLVKSERPGNSRERHREETKGIEQRDGFGGHGDDFEALHYDFWDYGLLVQPPKNELTIVP